MCSVIRGEVMRVLNEDANAQMGGFNVGYEDVMGRFADGTMGK